MNGVREKNDLRTQIMDAARDLFIQEGYENVSMRKIADRIEYSPTAIYLHFKDKSQLLKSICTDTFTGLASALENISVKLQTGKHDPVGLLKRGLHLYVEFGLAHPNHYQLTFLSPHDDMRHEDPICMQAFGYLIEGVESCIAAGGSITGEHGVGSDKACYMPKMFSSGSIAVMGRVRDAFDPRDVCNPGKALPTPRLCGEVPGMYRPHAIETAGLAERL